MSEATNPPAGGKELTREQLLTYVKKAKLKIRKLESEVLELKEKAQPALEVPSEAQDDMLASMWGGITSMATGIVTEVTSVVKDEADDNDASSARGSASSLGNAPPANASIYRDGEETLDASSLNETNAQLTTELAQIKESLREKTQMVDVLGDQVVKAETESMTITQKLEEGQTQLAQMQSLISSLTENANSEKGALQAQLVSTENKLSESRTSTKMAQDEMNKCRAEKNTEKERWNIEKSALEASVAEQSKLFQKAEDKAQQLIESERKRSGEVKKDKDDLEMAIAEQTKRAEKAEEEIMVLCEQQVAAENDVKKLHGKIKELEQENAHAAKKMEKAGSNATAADSAARFGEKMKTLEKERDALKAAVEFNVSSEKSSSSKLTQTEELQKKTLAKLKEIKSENSKLKHELKELKSIHEKISKDDIEVQSKVATHKDEVLAQLKEKDETIIAAEAALLKAKEDLSAKESDYASSKAETKAHMAELEKHKCEIEALKKEAQKHKSEAEKHKSDAAKLKFGTEKHQTELQRLRDEIEKVQAEENAMKAASKKDEATLQAFRKAEEGLKANTADSNGKISSLQSEVSALKQQIESLEKEANSTTTTLHESQAQVIALEDNLRSLTSESESYRSKMDSTQEVIAKQQKESERKMNRAEKEADEAREERERQRRRVLELEGMIENSEMLVREAEADRERGEAEKGSLAKQNAEMTDKLSGAESRVKELESSLALKESELESSKQKTDTLSDKVARLKTLLQRSKQLAMEKEEEVAKMTERASATKSFQVISSVVVEINNDSVIWHCVLDHDDTSSARWVKESETQEWIKSGSSLVDKIPETIQTQHSRDVKSVRINLEKERDRALCDLKDLNEAFLAYKARAQTALKRVGNEERQSKQHEEELQRSIEETASLSKLLESTEQQLNDALEEIKTKTQSLEAQGKTSDDERKAALAEKKAFEEKIAKKVQETEAAHNSARSLENRLEQLNQALELQRQQQQQQQHSTPVSTKKSPVPLQDMASTPTTPMTTSHTPSSSTRATTSTTESSENREHQSHFPRELEDYSITSKTKPATKPVMSAADASARNEFELSQLLTDGETGDESSVLKDQVPMYPFMSPQGQNVPQSPNMLSYVSDDKAHQEIADLRQQIETITSDYHDIQHKFGLNVEQLASLKSVIRELQATVAREREFNTTDEHSVNMEYLTNVLRKFLLSAVPSERSRLASVLCQILRFTSAEVHEINDIWQERKGLAGWFQKRSLAGIGPGGVNEGNTIV
jgi:chromosome segregation ATPase